MEGHNAADVAQGSQNTCGPTSQHNQGRKRKSTATPRRLSARQQRERTWSVIGGVAASGLAQEEETQQGLALQKLVLQPHIHVRDEQSSAGAQSTPRKRTVRKDKKRAKRVKRRRTTEHQDEDATQAEETITILNSEEDQAGCVLAELELLDQLQPQSQPRTSEESDMGELIASIQLVPFKSTISRSLISDEELDESLTEGKDEDLPKSEQLRATLMLFTSSGGEVVACVPFDATFVAAARRAGGAASPAEPSLPEALDAILALLRHAPQTVGLYARYASPTHAPRRVLLRILLHPTAFRARHADELKHEKPKLAFHALRQLMAWTYPGTIANLYDEESSDKIGTKSSTESFNPTDLYAALSRCSQLGRIRWEREENHLADEAHHEGSIPGLVAILRSYQRMAVEWMKHREQGGDHAEEERSNSTKGDESIIVSDKGKEKITGTEEDESDEEPEEPPLHPLWNEYKSMDGITFYFNQFTGKFSDIRFAAPSDTKGGILADEMGLGKTVEVLALILAHPRPSQTASSQTHQVEEPLSRRTRGNTSDTKHVPKRKRDEAESSTDSVDEEDQVWCYCGDNDPNYAGMWVQCQTCRRWQHAACVGFVPSSPQRTVKKRRRTKKSKRDTSLDASGKGESSEDERLDITETLNDDAYECPGCSAQGGKQLESRATLIVCPDSILSQWKHEIERHTLPGALKVLIYEGVRGTVCKHSGGLAIVRPAQLVDYDIVLTTYTTLRNDLSHVILQSPGRNFRDKKRYRPIPTPLLGVRFWRTCLDEVQMIETPSTKVAKMALRLSTINKWGVSGTPIQRRGLEDLHGLIAFLQLKPFDSKSIWRQCVQLPYERGQIKEKLHDFLRTVMWRTSKEDVLSEINIPPLQEKIRFLKFSAVEAHFYKKRLGDTVQRTQIIFERLKHSRFINVEKNIAKIFNSLLVLRQACCHPQVGSKSGFTSLQKSTMTMNELLTQLIIRTMVECADAQRNLVAAFNGLAGVALINGDKAQAIHNYRKVLNMEFRPIDEEGRKQLPAGVNEAEIISVDALQRLHALANLAEVLHNLTDSEKIELGKAEGHTLNDHRLVDEASKLRELYAKKAELEQLVTQAKWKEASKKIKDAEDALITDKGSIKLKPEVIDGEDVKEREARLNAWWIEALNLISDRGEENEFIAKLRNDLLDKEERERGKLRGQNSHALSLAHRFQSVATLKHILFSELKDLRKKRDAAIGVLLLLGDRTPTAADVELSGNCKQCRHYLNKSGQVCDHCKAHVLLLNYDACLYRYRQKAPNEKEEKQGQKRREEKKLTEEDDTIGFGSFRESSEAEQMLTHIVRHLRGTTSNSEEQEDWQGLLHAGSEHIKRFQLMKQELKLSHEVWTKQKERLSALDELEMATVRIRLRVPGEIVPPEEEVVKLWPVQVEEVKRRLEVMKNEAETELQRAKGQLRYLKTLAENKSQVDKAALDAKQSDASQQIEKEEGKECAICQEPIKKDSDIVLLLCGHSFCCQCIMTMMDRATHGTIKCPTCRTRMNTAELTFFSNTATASAASFLLMKGSEPMSEQERAQAMIEVADEEEEKATEVNGSWGTKIEGVIRSILHVQKKARKLDEERGKGKEKDFEENGSSTANSVKCLVFSQWDDVLLLVSRALDANGIANIRLRTSNKKVLQRDLDIFKSRSDMPVLLLPIRSGCNGLNLIEATHVFIVEPSLNIGAEAQAVGRVHRIGQTRQTYVYRYFIQDTIETKIFQHVYQKSNYRDSVETSSIRPDALPEATIRQSEEEQDLLWEENMSHFHKSKIGRQCAMSLAQLGELLTEDQAKDRSEEATQATVPPELSEDERRTNEMFWAGVVEFNRRQLSRSDALKEIERIASWEKRWNRDSTAESSDVAGESIVRYGRTVPVSAWLKLEALRSVQESENETV